MVSRALPFCGGLEKTFFFVRACLHVILSISESKFRRFGLPDRGFRMERWIFQFISGWTFQRVRLPNRRLRMEGITKFDFVATIVCNGLGFFLDALRSVFWFLVILWP